MNLQVKNAYNISAFRWAIFSFIAREYPKRRYLHTLHGYKLLYF